MKENLIKSPKAENRRITKIKMAMKQFFLNNVLKGNFVCQKVVNLCMIKMGKRFPPRNIQTQIHI